jgi:toxin-antitoxin system PIN domain toxin
MPDVNMLVYAHREDSTHHRRAFKWLDRLVLSDSPFAVSSLVAVGFVRVVTHTSVFPDRPSSLAIALEFVEELLSADGCRLLMPGPEHWKIFSRLCSSSGARGKHVADAQHAAIAIEWGCTLVTADSDFQRFDSHGLDWNHFELD